MMTVFTTMAGSLCARPRLIAAAIIRKPARASERPGEILLVRRLSHGQHWLLPATQVAERSDDDLIVLREALAREIGQIDVPSTRFAPACRITDNGIIEDGGSMREVVLEVFRPASFQTTLGFDEGGRGLEARWLDGNDIRHQRADFTPVTYRALDYFIKAGLI